MIHLLVATRNAHKTIEIAALLHGFFKVEDLHNFPKAPEIEEVGDTFVENAILKANSISRFIKGWALADDSGLEVDALCGEPGVRSARYAGENATDSENNALLLSRLSTLPNTPRTARFRCALALSKNGELLITFEGTVEGRVTESPRGTNGFGYDSLFIPNGYEATFGELPAAVKNSISHRSQALTKFRTWLKDYPIIETFKNNG